jgi:hypothetical protein
MTNRNESGGISAVSVLTIVFVVLKLTRNIDWSWWWVLSPLWISFGACVLIGALLAIASERRPR